MTPRLDIALWSLLLVGALVANAGPTSSRVVATVSAITGLALFYGARAHRAQRERFARMRDAAAARR